MAERFPELPHIEELHVHDLLRFALYHKASEVYIAAGLPPVLKIDGQWKQAPCQQKNFTRFTPIASQRLCGEILTEEQRQAFAATERVDFFYTPKGLPSYHVCLFHDKEGNIVGNFYEVS